MRLKRIYMTLAMAALVFTSCSDYSHLLKSSNNKAKLAAANNYFNQGKYDKALELYDNILPFYKASSEAEEVAYHYAKAYYLDKQYLLAAYHLKNFTVSYPTSPYTEECAYLVGKSYARVSPWYKLDQEYSTKAISELQAFANQYPASKFKEDANKTVDEIREKLDMKARNAAILYYNIGNYNATMMCLHNFIIDFPDSKYIEWAQYMIAKSQFMYANNSIDTKKEERYKDCLKAIKLYENSYSKGEYLKETRKMTDEILNYFKKNNISI
jgi:outer membrane protein assembly factor BamD